MALKIGITGGIGAGKSIVCRIFKTLGIPVYDADLEAKLLMVKDENVKKALIDIFGPETYLNNGDVNRAFLSNQVFKDQKKLDELNAVVHPAVIQHGIDWANNQTGPYSLKEAALLFESGSYFNLDKVILVTAPENIRIQRVVQRDGVSKQQVQDRISKQMPEEQKLQMADIVIVNDGIRPLIPQVYDLHHQFLKEVHA